MARKGRSPCKKPMNSTPPLTTGMADGVGNRTRKHAVRKASGRGPLAHVVGPNGDAAIRNRVGRDFQGFAGHCGRPGSACDFGQWVIETSTPSELAPLDVPEAMPSRLKEVLGPIARGVRMALRSAWRKPLLERLAGHRFGLETTEQFTESIATLQWSSLQLQAEMTRGGEQRAPCRGRGLPRRSGR